MFKVYIFHLWEVVQIFQRKSIFHSKISSGGSLFIKRIVPGEPILGVHFYHDSPMTDSEKRIHFQWEIKSVLSQSQLQIIKVGGRYMRLG